MRPSPSLPDIDHSVPVLRLIVAGVFLLALFIIATIGSTAPAEEDPMRARLAGVLDPGLRDKLEHYAETMAAYAQAVAEGYRFFSYGDAMFITRNPAPRGPEEFL